MSYRLRRCLGSLALVVGLAAVEGIALASGTVEEKTIVVSGKGSVGFAVDAEGPITARVTVSKPSTIEVFGPSGSKGKKSGKESIEIVVSAADVKADLAKGRLWSVAVTTEAGQTFNAPLRVEHGGKAYNNEELLKLVSASISSTSKLTAPATATAGPPAQVTAAKTAATSIHAPTMQLSVIGLGAIRRASGPAYLPKPVTAGQRIAAGSAPSSYGGSSATPTPPTTHYVQINSITLSGDPSGTAARNCPATCGLTAGETLTIITAPGLSSAGQEVHFVNFADNSDITVAPLAWSDSAVVVQVPRFSSAGNVDGALYLGTPNSSTQSTFYGFHYIPNAPTIVSRMVHWTRTVPDGVPSTVRVRQTSTFAWPEATTIGAVDDGNFFSSLRACYIGSTGSPFDLFFKDYHLVNGWKVKKVHFIGHSMSMLNGAVSLVESHEGTDDMTARVDWNYGANGGIDFQIGWEIEGPDNTNPFM